MKRTLSLLSCIVMVALLSSCMKGGGANPSSAIADSNKAKTQAFYDQIINAHSVNNLDNFIATSFTDHNPDPGMNGVGIENNKKNFMMWFASMPDVQIHVDNMVADSDMVWVMYHMTATMKGDMGPMKATGKSCNVGGIDVIKIKDGKATDRWGYYDQMAMMSQLGLMPPPPPPAPAGKS